MPTSLTSSESLYGRHTCMHIRTYIHTNGALSRPQGLSNSWPGPPLPLSQQAITPSAPLPATPCGHMPHSPARQAQCWPNSLAAHPCHALWWHHGHMGLLLLVHTHTHKHAVQGAPHQGQLLEIEFIEKLGQSVLVRSRHGQTGILAYACYTKLFPFLPFCLCFLTVVPPLTITFPTFISFPKHPTSPVQSPNALPCTPHGTLHARQCPWSGEWSREPPCWLLALGGCPGTALELERGLLSLTGVLVYLLPLHLWTCEGEIFMWWWLLWSPRRRWTGPYWGSPSCGAPLHFLAGQGAAFIT